MNLDCVMLYVADVPATVKFYEQAFGMSLRFMNDDSQYAQMETGATAIAFANEAAGRENSGLELRPNRIGEMSAAIQIALVTPADTIETAFERVVAAGGTVAKPPTAKPWGQIIGCVRDNNGVLIEIGTPANDDWQAA